MQIPVYRDKTLVGFFDYSNCKQLATHSNPEDDGAWVEIYELPGNRFIEVANVVGEYEGEWATLMTREEVIEWFITFEIRPPGDLFKAALLIDFSEATQEEYVRKTSDEHVGPIVNESQQVDVMPDTGSPGSPFSPSLPPAIDIGGIVYVVGHSPHTGPGWLPVDLAAALNLARANLSMARRLLKMTKGLIHQHLWPQVYQSGLDPDTGQWRNVSNEMVGLANEIISQNGVVVITALFPQLTEANTTGQPIRVGRVEGPSAHAAACAAANQLANEVLLGEPLTVTASDLDCLEELILQESTAAVGCKGTQPHSPRLARSNMSQQDPPGARPNDQADADASNARDQEQMIKSRPMPASATVVTGNEERERVRPVVVVDELSPNALAQLGIGISGPKLKGNNRVILDVMRFRDSMDEDDFVAEVWGHDGASTNALKTAICRFNGDPEAPFNLAREDGKIRKIQ
jgi:hypothetical protein